MMEIDSEIVPDDNMTILGPPRIEPDSGLPAEAFIPVIAFLFIVVLYLIC